MGRVRALLSCTECGQPVTQWAGRCPGCGAWGSIAERPGPASGRGDAPASLSAPPGGERRVATGFAGVDRVLGGGLVPGSVVLLAGEPGIGKSTLLLQLVANLSVSGLTCLLASGEESRDQVAGRARRLGLDGGDVSFIPGRELSEVLGAARSLGPFLLAVDSIQTVRDSDSPSIAGGTAQVRSCADGLVGLAKEQGVAVLLTGHVTKDGDVAGPRTLEHAVDVVLSFEGDPRSGLRILCGGKNRFGHEGEVAWFEMGAGGLAEIDPTGRLVSSAGQAGSATALPVSGRRAYAIEVQALAAPTDGAPRRQATGLDLRRFSLVAAVLDQVAHIPVGRKELYGATAAGMRVDDPACDLAVAAALASAASGVPPPAASAFVGELGLTGYLRPAPGMEQRIAAARAAGIETIFAAGTAGGNDPRIVSVEHISQAISWAITAGEKAKSSP